MLRVRTVQTSRGLPSGCSRSGCGLSLKAAELSQPSMRSCVSLHVSHSGVRCCHAQLDGTHTSTTLSARLAGT